ncbi:MAG: YjjG family noncanonical pyrimidine nucleotidase [Clostridia bacterium]|nr:YjjG family noncanonical pyrimidine nucleotidase [Clostridia bacterium]
MSKRYDLLLCDADNTIFDFEKAEELAFYDACAVAGLTATPQLLHTYSVINQSLWELLERGGITQSVLRVRRFELFLEKIGYEFNAPAMATAFTDSLGRQGVPLAGAFEALERWSRLVPVIIVTNGISKVQHGRMDHCPIAPFLSGLVISEEVGAAKPDPRMLEIGMEMANVTDKRRVLMLGDSLSSDIAAAANAGIDACWFNPKGAKNTKGLPVAYEITSLDEVDGILSGEKE